MDSDDNDFVKEIIELSGGGVDVAFECVGNVEAAETSLEIVKSGSTVLLFGLPDQAVTLSLKLQSLFHKEISIKTSFLNPFTFQTAVDLLVTGKISVEQFNPVQVPFNNEEVVSLFNNSKDNSVVKYMVIPNN